MRLVLLLVWLMVAGWHAALGQAFMSKDKKALKYFQKAKELQAQRDFPGALAFYDRAIQRDSSFAEAYRLAAAAWLVLDKADKAMPYYRELVRRFPEVPRYSGAYLQLAEAELARGEYQPALRHIEKYLTFITKTDRHYRRAIRIRDNCRFALAGIKKPLPFNPQPLPPPINQFKQQYFPVLTADQRTLFFIKRDHTEQIYTSTRQPDGSWTVPQPIDEEITSEYNEGTCTISADGRTLVFTSCMRQDGLGSCDLYITYKHGDKWSRPVNMGRPVNSAAWDSQPALSADARTLYFVSNRGGGVGQRDIWVTYFNDSTGWSSPQNLGPAINTPGDDISPFIHVNGKTLYFSSNDRIGYGSYDIYYANKDSTGQWGEVHNFGYPVNTHEDELAMFITADGRYGYYSHENYEDGELISKIYRIDIPEEIALPYRSGFVSGRVYDSLSGKPLAARLELVNLSADEKVSVVTSDSVTGNYLLVLTEGADYALYVRARGYLFRSYYFSFEKTAAQLQGIRIDVPMSKAVAGKRTVLNNVFFAFDSYALTDKSKKALQKVIDFLLDNPALRVEIAGHTDNVGDESYNKKLSEQRARAVFDFFVANGISADRMRYQGYGSSRPVADNGTEVGRARNRRIELLILE